MLLAPAGKKLNAPFINTAEFREWTENPVSRFVPFGIITRSVSEEFQRQLAFNSSLTLRVMNKPSQCGSFSAMARMNSDWPVRSVQLARSGAPCREDSHLSRQVLPVSLMTRRTDFRRKLGREM
jgi:hypothetical protein